MMSVLISAGAAITATPSARTVLRRMLRRFTSNRRDTEAPVQLMNSERRLIQQRLWRPLAERQEYFMLTCLTLRRANLKFFKWPHVVRQTSVCRGPANGSPQPRQTEVCRTFQRSHP
jgi:hypothetical protein